MKKLDSEKVKVIKNKKIILGVLALLMSLAVIVIFSFVPYALTPERLLESEFITDMLILCAIVLLAMIAALFIGQASNAQNIKSNIAIARVKFEETMLKVKEAGTHKFKQWIRKVRQVEDTKIVKSRIFGHIGLDDADLNILNLSETEIKTLSKPQKIDGVYYKALSNKQIKKILDLKENGIKIPFVNPDYYLSCKNLIDTRTTSERASSEGKKKIATLGISVGSKLILTLLTGVIFTLFTRDILAERDAAEAFAKLFVRLLTFTTSIFLGYIVGCQLNDIDAEYINMRTLTQMEFLEDTDFKEISAQEEAKQQFIERMKEEQRTPLLSDNTIYLPATDE